MGRSGIVLAGGRSRRFGPEDKALAELNGDTLVERVVDRVSAVTDEVVVSCRPAQSERIERALSASPVDGIVEDRHSGAGPLAGTEAAADAVSGDTVVVVACDMPLVEPAVLEDLFERASGVEAVVPRDEDGQLQPVQAVYRTEALRRTAARNLPDGGSLHEVIDALAVETVPVDSFPARSFHNVNTRRDLVAAEHLCTARR